GDRWSQIPALHCGIRPTGGSRVVFHDVGVLSQKLFPIVEAMQKHFGSGAYYSNAIFFLSVAMHHILEGSVLFDGHMTLQCPSV
uniref:Uncharacterized protein n=1 Tax=Salmo trutta TaxID=8032 RepID=A0A673YKJ6_SALTR